MFYGDTDDCTSTGTHVWEVKGDGDALYQECNDCGYTKDYDEWEVIATGYVY